MSDLRQEVREVFLAGKLHTKIRKVWIAAQAPADPVDSRIKGLATVSSELCAGCTAAKFYDSVNMPLRVDGNGRTGELLEGWYNELSQRPQHTIRVAAIEAPGSTNLRTFTQQYRHLGATEF